MARRRRAQALRNRLPSDEAFRILRSNLEVSIADLQNPTVIVTSALPGEGKSSTTAGLARALAAAGRRVVVVDVDLRHPDTHRWLNGHNEVGMSEVLLDRVPLTEALQYLQLRDSGDDNKGLYLLSTGAPVNNPTELLTTGRMSRLMAVLAEQADVLLLDTPPVLPVADTLVIGRMAAGALLVVQNRKTPLTAVNQAKDALTRNQTRLLGVVLNMADERETEFGYGYGDAQPVAEPA